MPNAAHLQRVLLARLIVRMDDCDAVGEAVPDLPRQGAVGEALLGEYALPLDLRRLGRLVGDRNAARHPTPTRMV